MKKIWLAGLVAVFGIALLGTSAFAGCGMGGGMGLAWAADPDTAQPQVNRLM